MDPELLSLEDFIARQRIMVVDPTKLQALSDEELIAWHKHACVAEADDDNAVFAGQIRAELLRRLTSDKQKGAH